MECFLFDGGDGRFTFDKPAARWGEVMGDRGSKGRKTLGLATEPKTPTGYKYNEE
ncbi:MAG: hypothetical protein K2N35_02975 [Muribaculaceae bacterium]|nr:hypothetical protein [Muribaculaceae bacterium]